MTHPSSADEMPTGSTALPLLGVRVVELSLNIAGPYSTMILGDLGAEVTKVERPPHGDDSRRMTPTLEDSSAYFLAVNRNKRSVTLDIRDPVGRRRFDSLLAGADVFVTSLRPEKLRELHLTCADLQARWPELIYADLSGYGGTGKEGDRPGYDMILQARSGIMSVNGEPTGDPVRIGVSVLDLSAGTWLALGVMAALLERQRIGRGVQVSTSLLEAGVNFMAYDLASYQLTGNIPGRRGSEHPAFGPYGVFMCKDQSYLAIGVGADHLFHRFAHAVARPEWITNPRFRDNSSRVAHRTELRSAIEERLSVESAEAWAQELSSAGVPADVVSTIPQVLADPQVEDLAMWIDIPLGTKSDAHERSIRIPGLPVRVDQQRLSIRFAPPPLSTVWSADADAE